MERNPLLTTVGGLRRLLGEAPGLRPIYRLKLSKRRCKQCFVPFQGLFAVPFHIMWIRPSRKNPNLCTM